MLENCEQFYKSRLNGFCLSFDYILQVSTNTNSEADLTELLVCMENIQDVEIQLDVPQLDVPLVLPPNFWQKVENWYGLNKKNYFLSGFFLKKIIEKHSCDNCAVLVEQNTPQFMENKQKECGMSYHSASHDFSVYLKVRKLIKYLQY